MCHNHVMGVESPIPFQEAAFLFCMPYVMSVLKHCFET